MKAPFDCYAFYEFNLKKQKYILVGIYGVSRYTYRGDDVKEVIKNVMNLTQVCHKAARVLEYKQEQEIDLEFEY